jgi:membrane fusion protein (multidrug efflux system)
MSQQEQVASVPARPDGTASVAAPAVARPSGPASAFWGRFAIPLFAVLAALAFIALATVRWNEWTGDAIIQATDDAYVQADLTRLSSRVAGEVLSVAVQDFQRVKAGDVLVQIDPADYQADVAHAEAGVVGAQAALENLANQIELQYATIAQSEAQRVSAEAQQVETGQERVRQEALSKTDAGTLQKLQQAVAADDRAQADVRASRAVVAERRHQLEVLNGTKKQRAADLDAAKADLATAKLKLGYTRVVAPFDGVTSERQVQPGDYVNIGTNLINVVPLPNVYVIANYKETQLTHVEPGQPVEITVDSFPKQILHGHVERISPASGSQFALLPPDNATGNFTKVVQRIPVRIMFDGNQPLLDRLLPGMSVVTSIDTRDARANGAK